MPKFVVEVREVHIAYHLIEASSREAAIAKVSAVSRADEVILEYSHTLPKEEWAVVEDGITYYYNDFTHKFDRKMG